MKITHNEDGTMTSVMSYNELRVIGAALYQVGFISRLDSEIKEYMRILFYEANEECCRTGTDVCR